MNFLSNFLLILCISFSLFGVVEGKGLSKEQNKMYFDALNEELAAAENRAAILLSQMQRNPARAKEFDHANRMVKVKRSLAKNFISSKAIEDISVRWKLLEVIQKDTITKEDLSSLQAQVNKVLGR